MSFALLFSGQGFQHPQMLPWLDDGSVHVQRSAQALGVVAWRQALHDPAWAIANLHAQILLTGLGLAAWWQLAPRLPAPAAVAGYSVGELAAFSAACVFDFDTALRLAQRRAAAMNRCAEQAPGGLLAITGLDTTAVAALCAATAGVSVAIRIAADAVVVGGAPAALEVTAQRANERGAKVSPLNVAVASHTPSMHAAAVAFAAELRGVSLSAPSLPLFCNVSGERVHDAAQAALALSRQIEQTVCWADTLEALHARHVACVLEVGPGAALASMWNRRFPDVPARSADEFRSADAVVDWVLRRIEA
jgi:[acyl-carrier-protein] S-malonyltransferase